MYLHRVIRVNYTTYDIHRCQDSINPRSRSDIITLSPEGSVHPFDYSRVIGIFHLDVLIDERDRGEPKLTTLDVLWVRRFRIDHNYRAGFSQRRLYRVEFLPDSDPSAYGFLNPDEVIRQCHLIPAFAHGKSTVIHDCGEWESEGEGPETTEWRYHYVNIFADSDMYMRYAGGGPGHYPLKNSDTHVTVPLEENPVPIEENPAEVAAASMDDENRAVLIDDDGVISSEDESECSDLEFDVSETDDGDIEVDEEVEGYGAL
ncbi:hypothetical protein VKT23_013942 [Stygiomarasmius scandens]|uniref:Uncharacterized protein n=1 Tax=Marasmiellus scandens TaxID=2682957 RepID=A0ABR1J550_9AGAR